jgi:transposase
MNLPLMYGTREEVAMAGTCIRVGVDVGGETHHVGIACPEGNMLEEFDISHDRDGFERFFDRIEQHRKSFNLPVAVAMEGHNGHARPLDREVQARGYALHNVNNLKLARFKEVFSSQAKTDPIDTRKILELFLLNDHLPVARGVLQQVPEVPEENRRLKRLTRRRTSLVNEKVRVSNRLTADLNAVSPGLSSITGSTGNLWFLNFLTCRDDLRKLASMRTGSLLSIKGVGERYAGAIREWQDSARFSEEVEYVGPMIIEDARRLLQLKEQIAALEKGITSLAECSEIARLINSIPGFGTVSAAELAGEIGTLERFRSEESLALYLGMCSLDRQSGKSSGSRAPRQVNRRGRRAMMTAVAIHARHVPQSNAYYTKKRQEGKKHNQAIRSLGRHMVRVIFSMVSQGREYEIREVE